MFPREYRLADLYGLLKIEVLTGVLTLYSMRHVPFLKNDMTIILISEEI
jgi:hypothetical protein